MSTTPKLPETSLIRYLKQIFKVPALEKCRTVRDAIKTLRETDYLYLPEGFDEDCAVIFERTNVRGNLWALTAKSELAQMALENGEDFCLLVPDATLQGADSLFLCALYVSDSDHDMNIGLSSAVRSWTQKGCPQITICGYRDKQYGGTVHIVAAQLKSLV